MEITEQITLTLRVMVFQKQAKTCFWTIFMFPQNKETDLPAMYEAIRFVCQNIRLSLHYLTHLEQETLTREVECSKNASQSLSVSGMSEGRRAQQRIQTNYGWEGQGRALEYFKFN